MVVERVGCGATISPFVFVPENTCTHTHMKTNISNQALPNSGLIHMIHHTDQNLGARRRGVC